LREKLDHSILKMVEALEVHGPRNISKVARRLGMPSETLRRRVQRMRSRSSLHFYLNIYHTNLGLKKALVIAEAIPGYEDLLFDCLKTHDYWLYVNRYYGANEGCLGVFTIPKDYCDDFEQFMQNVEKLGIAQHVQIFWSTCFQSVHAKSNWFNDDSKTWDFHWNEWVKEIPAEETKLPITLHDPEDFQVKGDRTDILILKELEKNPLVKLTDIAKTLGISQQLTEYHFQKHVLAQGLIEGFEARFPYFGKHTSDRFLFLFKFYDYETFAKFASSLLDKPFVHGLGKVFGQNALIAFLYLPRVEFRHFIDVLSGLIREGVVQSYTYMIQDLRKATRQTISYEYFKDEKWVYEHQRHMKNLEDLVNARGPKKNVEA